MMGGTSFSDFRTLGKSLDYTFGMPPQERFSFTASFIDFLRRSISAAQKALVLSQPRIRFAVDNPFAPENSHEVWLKAA
jgi:hypothetical protein